MKERKFLCTLQTQMSVTLNRDNEIGKEVIVQVNVATKRQDNCRCLI